MYWEKNLIASIVYMVKTPKKETLFKNELFDVYYNSTDNLEQDKYTELYDYI